MCTFNLTKEHSAWVQSMAKYRRLSPMDDKAAMLEALDERFGCFLLPNKL